MVRKNHVGRPSNEELKRRRNKKILLIGAPIALVGILVILISTGGISKLMGNSVTEYYCEDSTYNLDGTDCVKTITKKAALLGDINSDEKVDNTDLNVLNNYVKDQKSVTLSEIQLKAADINSDGMISELDVQILEGFFSKVAATYAELSEKIGVERLCEDDYTLNGKYCYVVETVQAKRKEQSTSSEDKNQKTEVSTKDSIGVKFETQTKGTSAPQGTKYRFNVKFDLKNVTNTYYYRWRTYKGDKENFVGGCYKVTSTNEHVKDLTIIDAEPRYGTITYYSDSKCTNQVNELPIVKTETYKCSNCVPLTISFDKKSSASQRSGTVIKTNVQFNIKDKEFTYYYRWRTYNNNSSTPHFEGKCLKVTANEKHEKELTINKNLQVRKGTITVYYDNKCSNRVSSVPIAETPTYKCSNCNVQSSYSGSSSSGSSSSGKTSGGNTTGGKTTGSNKKKVTCTCPSGSKPIGGECFKPSTKYNIHVNKVPKCPSTYQIDSTKKKCLYLVSGKVATGVRPTYVCPSGAKSIGGECFKPSTVYNIHVNKVCK